MLIAPLAAGLDWIEALLPVLFIGFWVLSQIIAIGKKLAGPGNDKVSEKTVLQEVRPAKRPRPVVPASPSKASGRAASDIQDEIREFLGRGQAPSAGPVRSTPRPPPILEPRAAKATVAEKVRQDFSKELEHLSTPLTADQTLATTDRAAAVSSAGPVGGAIPPLLRSPATLRQLVLAREILERPVDRW